MTTNGGLIDKVTVNNLDYALRLSGIVLHKEIIDKVIDLVELIENKGDDFTLQDIVELRQVWKKDIEIHFDFKTHRDMRNLSLRDVAKVTGLSISTISRIENGKDALYPNVITLYNFYNK